MNNPKLIFVTGANRGIGLGLTQHLLQNGNRVLMGCRSQQKFLQASQQLKGQGLPQNYEYIEIDINNAQSYRNLQLGLQGRKLDALINNAGVNLEKRPNSNTARQNFEQTFRTNFFSTIGLTHFVLQNNLINDGGVVITIGSNLGKMYVLTNNSL